jgi:hypothetical protein
MRVKCLENYNITKGIFNKQTILVLSKGNYYMANVTTGGEYNSSYFIIYGDDKKWHKLFIGDMNKYLAPA